VLLAWSFLSLAWLAEAQDQQSTLSQVARTGPVRCRDWASAIPSIKEPYLEGLELGYLTAVDDVYTYLGQADTDSAAKLSAGLSPRLDKHWFDLIPSIDSSCTDQNNNDKEVAKVAVAILDDSSRMAEVRREARTKLLLRYKCADVVQNSSPWFLVGYRDGQRFFWSVLRQTGDVLKAPDFDRYLTNLNTFQFEIPLGKDLHQGILEFCADPAHSNSVYGAMPYDAAAKIVAFQLRGQDADPLIAYWYCRDLPPTWSNGQQFIAKTCFDVTVLIGTSPVLDKPFGYMVGVINNSQKQIEVDWTQWSLLWKDKSQTDQLRQALDPRRVSRAIEKRANVDAAFTAFGAYIAASAPRTAQIYGPDGISTVSVYRTSGEASAIATQAATSAAAPGIEFASVISSWSFLRNTLAPGTATAGRVVYFDKPKTDRARLQIKIPNLPKFSLDVSTK
jgi:hypothetical protein